MRLGWKILGAISLALGIIGIFLPLLPTTPFLLLSAFCFQRGSEKLHNWLITHPRFGPPIEDWNRHGAISQKAKIIALASMALVLILSLAFGVALHIVVIQCVVLCAVAIFILSRPLPPA